MFSIAGKDHRFITDGHRRTDLCRLLATARQPQVERALGLQQTRLLVDATGHQHVTQHRALCFLVDGPADIDTARMSGPGDLHITTLMQSSVSAWICPGDAGYLATCSSHWGSGTGSSGRCVASTQPARINSSAATFHAVS